MFLFVSLILAAFLLPEAVSDCILRHDADPYPAK